MTSVDSSIGDNDQQNFGLQCDATTIKGSIPVTGVAQWSEAMLLHAGTQVRSE